MNSKILPWQTDQWKLLQYRKQQNQLPHAILLIGLSGLGKAQFAKQFGQSLICESPKEDGIACGLCRQCEWILEGVHPDWFELTPIEGNKAIKIDDVRALIIFQQKTFSIATAKLILIHRAHQLNKNAANALLKTLEEPGDRTHILLDTHDVARLPMAIRSRCQILSFNAPPRDEGLAWILRQNVRANKSELNFCLSLANGAPLCALMFLKQKEWEFHQTLMKEFQNFYTGQLSLVDLSARWAKLDIRRIFRHFETWMYDLIYLAQNACESILNQDMLPIFEKISKYAEKNELYLFLDFFNEIKSILKQGIALNTQLVLEDLLIRYRRLG